MQWPMKLFQPRVRVIRWPNHSLHESLTHHFHILIRYSVVYIFVITFLVAKNRNKISEYNLHVQHVYIYFHNVLKQNKNISIHTFIHFAYRLSLVVITFSASSCFSCQEYGKKVSIFFFLLFFQLFIPRAQRIHPKIRCP